MPSRPLLRIGTRASQLARAQTLEVVDALKACFPELSEPGAIEVTALRTTGDTVRDRPLAEIGGKGLFTKELDRALLEDRIDLAVNSLKDVPTWLEDGVALAAVPERLDPRDALIAREAMHLTELPQGAVFGTASPRRQAQVLHARPDIEARLLRGNVETRLKRVEDGAVDATLLAVAGLERAGLLDRVAAVLDPDEMLPAVGQGALGLTSRAADERTRRWLAALEHTPSAQAAACERALLEALDGSCRTPIGGLAEIDAAGRLKLRALVATPDGRELLRTERMGPAIDAAALGRDAGDELRKRAGAGFFEGG